MPAAVQTDIQNLIQRYRDEGHVTVEDIFTEEQMRSAIDDAHAWGEQIIAKMDQAQRDWYLEKRDANEPALRKLDNPVAHRDAYIQLAMSPTLIQWVERLIGPGVSVFFSQIFFKPPEGGGPKPVHQDNFYFGPDDNQGMVTAWIALDEATIENGCLYYGKQTNLGPVHEHIAPVGEPFNLQLPEEIASQHQMSPAPVNRGGVSFHHGNTFHQSSANTSSRFRRACAMHFIRNDVRLVKPALEYDMSIVRKIT